MNSINDLVTSGPEVKRAYRGDAGNDPELLAKYIDSEEITQNLLVEKDILTPGDEGLRLQQQKNGIRLELSLVGKTAEGALEEALSTIQKVKATYANQKLQGFGFQEPSVKNHESKMKDGARLDRLQADVNRHFESHVQNGKLVHFDKDCSFCEAYNEKETASSSDSHQSYKKIARSGQ